MTVVLISVYVMLALYLIPTMINVSACHEIRSISMHHMKIPLVL